MGKSFYIIPGWEDIGNEYSYSQLAQAAKDAGYDVMIKEVDWKKPLSEQVFAVPSNAVIFGFSLGAILAQLIAQKFPCEHLILGSITPPHNFTNPEIRKALVELTGQEFVDDISSNLEPKNQAKNQTTLYGELEDEPGDILVPNTEHEMTPAYIDEIRKLL